MITGGTGSLGSQVIEYLLRNTDVRRIAVYSRDELKQQNMRDVFAADSRLRWFIGDVRDKERLMIALHDVDYVIHAAALKQVDTGEYNPMEFIKTNILGSQNIIDACIAAGVKKVVALSTDKASSPINLYGATKLTSDKLFIAANNYSFSYGTAFSVVRYGNVAGSRGSVIPFFLNLVQKKEPIPITDLKMTRFWITIEQAVEFVLSSFDLMQGGELFVPKIPSVRIIDIAKTISANSKILEVGIRPGEKLHEEMISREDMLRTVHFDDRRYIVNPVFAEWGYKYPISLNKVDEVEPYRSDTNKHWVSLEDLKYEIQKIKIK